VGEVTARFEFEEFLHDIALGDTIPTRRGVRNPLDNIGLQQEGI